MARRTGRRSRAVHRRRGDVHRREHGRSPPRGVDDAPHLLRPRRPELCDVWPAQRSAGAEIIYAKIALARPEGAARLAAGREIRRRDARERGWCSDAKLGPHSRAESTDSGMDREIAPRRDAEMPLSRRARAPQAWASGAAGGVMTNYGQMASPFQQPGNLQARPYQQPYGETPCRRRRARSAPVPERG